MQAYYIIPVGGTPPVDPGFGQPGHQPPTYPGGGPVYPPTYPGGGPVYPPSVGGGPIHPGQPPTIGGGPVYPGQPPTVGGGPVLPGGPPTVGGGPAGGQIENPITLPPGTQLPPDEIWPPPEPGKPTPPVPPDKVAVLVWIPGFGHKWTFIPKPPASGKPPESGPKVGG